MGCGRSDERLRGDNSARLGRRMVYAIAAVEHGTSAREGSPNASTLTFIPRPGGFVLGMNRDDRYLRPPAIAPAVYQCGSQQALYPVEPGSGTWIGVNQAGLGFAILNLSLPRGDKLHSRGEIIPRLAACSGLAPVAAELCTMNLAGTLPFRLIAVSSREQGIRECIWNGSGVQFSSQRWTLNHWFSSGRGDALAERWRRPVCQSADASAEAGSIEWLRKLHQSHAPEPVPSASVFTATSAELFPTRKCSATLRESGLATRRGTHASRPGW